MSSTARGNGEARRVTSDDGSNNNGKTDEDAQQHHSLLQLALCATGICTCFLAYGILQERLFSGSKRQRRMGATFVLMTQCSTNVGVAALWQRLEERQKTRKQPQNTSSSATKQQAKQERLPHALLALTAACYVTAMVCSNEALRYVSYPVQVLAKSCKLIPTMLVAQVVERRLYGATEWMAALCISAGIVLFHYSKLITQQEEYTTNDDTSSQQQQNKGMVLLAASLTMDGILSSCQNFLKQAQPRAPNAVETMLYINVYAAVLYLIPLSILTGQWHDGMDALLFSSQSCWKELLILNATIGIGQIFIFLTIAWFSPVTTTIITTTRKFFTILVSVWLYGHAFSTLQWAAVALVFTGLYYAIFSNTSSTAQQQQQQQKSGSKVLKQE